MNSRRSFLALTARTLLGAAILGFSPIVPRASANPLAALAVVNTALSVAGLFSRGGGDIEALLHMQVEMLTQIEKELKTIEDGIQEILNRLNELKEIIGDMPEQVVKTWNEAIIQGSVKRYSDIRETYLAEGSLSPQNKKDLEDGLIYPLKQARYTLMALPQPQFGLVPIICTACFIESLAMAMDVEGTSRKQRQVAIKDYRDWLVQATRGKSEITLEGKIAALREKQVQNTKAAYATPTPVRCYTGEFTEDTKRGGGFYRCFDYPRKIAVTPTQGTSQTVDQMVKLGLMREDERPLDISYPPDTTNPPTSELTPWPNGYVGRFWWPDAHASIEDPNPCAGTGHTLRCVELENADRAKVQKLSSLTSDGLQLISLRALRHAAVTTIRFTHDVDSAMNK